MEEPIAAQTAELDAPAVEAQAPQETSKPEEPDQGRAPEDADGSRDGSKDSSQKRKLSEREPESPNSGIEEAFAPFAKREKVFNYPELDSPATYPKHVLVPDAERPAFEDKSMAFSMEPPRASAEGSSVLTPDSQARRRDSNMDSSLFARDQHFHDVYRAPSYQEMEYNNSRSYGSQPASFEVPGDNRKARPRRWACDYCNVATFLSYEEACAHESACARRHQDAQQQQFHQGPHVPLAPTSYDARGQHQHTQGAHAAYHASQEVVTPPTPHQHHQPRYPPQGPPLPVLPHEQGYYHAQGGYYDQREDPYYNPGRQLDSYGNFYPQPPMTHGAPYGYMPQPVPRPIPQQKRMLLAMPTDNESLSDRQCYVRSEMLEIFAASDKDVAARHSKGAQKLQIGQVGIRCVHCAHLRPRDRAERAVCYPSSISRIYQTVADMQRFHFEQCQQIPEYVRQVYGKLKTTRPRGVGSPQTYWVQSAKMLGLVDTKVGIRFKTETTEEHQPAQTAAVVGKEQPAALGQITDMSIATL